MPSTLGQKLKQAREQQGLSLADVSHKTRIPIAKLQDMETDDYDTFGSPTYARCFLQTYAGFVGVDANSVTDHINPAPLGGLRDCHYLTESHGRWIGMKPDRSLMPDPRPVRSSKASIFVAAVIGAVLIGGGIWAKTHLVERKSPVAESKILPRHEVNPSRSGTGEKIRPAIPNRVTIAEDVRVRKALPVEDEPKSREKK